MSTCIRCGCKVSPEDTTHAFPTTIEGELLNVFIEIKDNGDCPVEICQSCVRKELVNWMALTAPTDELDAPATDDELPEWTAAFAAAAAEEGWGIDDNYWIVRDDDMAIFLDDAHAVSWVAKRAEEGSELHKVALEIHNRHLNN